MMGPLCESGQVFHSSSIVWPALTLMKFLPALALLWHAMSVEPKLAGSTKPRSWFRESQPAVAGLWPCGW